MKKKKDSPLKRLRRNRGVTQKKAAEDLGVTMYRYRKWEKHLSGASFDDAVRLSRYFDVPLRTRFFYRET